MNIGVIFTSYRMAEYLASSFRPWAEARLHNLGGHSFKICAVSCAFQGFDLPPEDFTTDDLKVSLEDRFLDQLLTSDQPVSEVGARGDALSWLISAGCDTIIQVDGDEIFAESDIVKIFDFVEKRPLIDWFRISYKNLVFTRNQYLAEPFAPPRIHRVRIGGYRAASFWDDNNIAYHGTITRDIRRDTDFASVTIPWSVAAPLHYTWLNNDRSRRKIEYQTKGRGWECSFAWDTAKGGLTFNEPYFHKRNLPIPEVLRLD